MNKISYTALSKYLECPESYRLHYGEKLRSIKIGSALVFGKAFDTAVMHLLIHKDLKKSLEVFEEEWTTSTDNAGNSISVYNNSLIEYRINDLDRDLLTPEEQSSECPQWYTLLHKGRILIKQYKKDILPTIDKVLGTQIEITLTNPQGDSVTGKCDYVVKLTTGEVVAFDLKTSSILYDMNMLKKSTQLAIYDVALKDEYKIDKVGYHVGIKHINKNKIKLCSTCGFDGSGTQFKTCNTVRGNKRCNGEWNTTIDPTGHFQVLIGEIDPIFKQSTVDNLNEVNFAVKNGIYFKNFNNCITKLRKCSFYDLCHQNSLEGLFKK